ncbi:MAG: transketolase [Myxococcota bacterium]
MSTELTPQLREQIENTIRFLAVDAVEAARSGHPGAPMGLARPAFELWDRHLRFDPSDPRWPLRDRFVLSNGHASMLQYALLHLFGFDLGLDDLKSFRQLGSRTPGHPEFGDTPGVELTTGPLGQGFAHGVGMALAARLTAARFAVDGEGPGAHRVFGIVSDGDLMEGLSHEAGSLAGHLGLGNLVYLYDDNDITIDGPTSVSFSEDVPRRFEAYGWHVASVSGDDVEGLRAAIDGAVAIGDRPSLISVKTVIGQGSPNKAGTSGVHGAALGADEVRLTKQAAGWPTEPTFLVPDEVSAHLSARAEAKKAEAAAANEALDRWRRDHPEKAGAWDAARERRLPADLGSLLAEGMDGVDNATRKHSAAVLQRASEAIPNLVGGSADLAGSAAPPIIKGRGFVGPGAEEGAGPFDGQNIFFGVREHAMAAIANGIALDGTLVPYCGTFLIFSDYMRPSIRLAALMKARTIFVFTHDSIFVGEDGPTHQPIEQLDSLRAIPGLKVFRPADGVETAMAYGWILEKADGPAALALSRQTLPALKRDGGFRNEDVLDGAYAVRQPSAKPDVVMLATGSEVALACDAAGLLGEQGIAARVVSVPCLELFMERTPEERAALVPQDGTPLVAVEAGVGQSLAAVIGPRGLLYTIDRFGASAPHKDLADYFGLTPEKLGARVTEFVKSSA